MSDPLTLSARQCLAMFTKKSLSPVELLDAVFARLDRVEPEVNAFVRVDRDGAYSAAHKSAARYSAGAPVGPVDGLIATIKDNVLAKGLPTRRGSRTTPDTPATEDSPATARLREAGAIILGKTTLPEIGWKGLGDSPLSGATRNPWRLDRTSGGSSAGAAVAAALGLGHFHLGTDGLGSIRIPAAFCGVFGFKPSYGRVPAYPLSTMSVLAHLGPLARRVEDAALMLSLIGRADMRDNTALNDFCPDFTHGLERGARRQRIGFSPQMGWRGIVDPDTAAAVEKAVKTFEALGAEVEIADPALPDTYDMAQILWRTGAAVALRSVSERDKTLIDPGLRQEMRLGEALPATAYLEAVLARGDVARAMARFHRRFDFLITPQMPAPAVPLGADTPPDSPYAHWLDWSPFTYPFNITQQPAASVPCGFTREGLPIALQIVGPVGADKAVLAAARAYESVKPFAFLDAPRAKASL